MNMILNEVNESFKYDLLEEERRNGNYYIRGVFSKADVINRNKRLYPRKILGEAVDTLQEAISAKGFVGELEHPSTPKINIDRISHMITKLSLMEDGSMVGEMKILDTPTGKILKALVDEGVYLGVSTRGTGSVVSKKYLGEEVKEVQDNFRLRAIDVVFEPSAGESGRPDFVVEGVTESGILLGGSSTFSKVWENIFGA